MYVGQEISKPTCLNRKNRSRLQSKDGRQNPERAPKLPNGWRCFRVKPKKGHQRGKGRIPVNEKPPPLSKQVSQIRRRHGDESSRRIPNMAWLIVGCHSPNQRAGQHVPKSCAPIMLRGASCMCVCPTCLVLGQLRNHLAGSWACVTVHCMT